METSLNVKLLAHTPNPDKVVAMAAKLCYKNLNIDELQNEVDSMTPEEIEKQVGNVIKAGHFSVTEHVCFTFGIEGVSRALTHQLVRHRIASYSHQSQRYVNANDFDYITPPSIAKDPEKKKMFEKLIKSVPYKDLSDAGIANEDARFTLPNAAETKIVVTMNTRSLYNFFEHRCCTRAQWEIRALADKMLEIVKEAAPILFKDAGAFCVSQKQCHERETCGKYKNIPGSRWMWADSNE